MTKRRGFSLIEMVAAIGGIVILAGLSVTLIHSLLRVERLERASLVQQTALAHLSRQFRQDVRSAQTVEPSGDDAGPLRGIVLKSPTHETIEYQAKDGSIVRTWRRSEKVERTESFKLSSEGTAQLSVSGKSDQAVVSLEIDRKAGKRGEVKSREFRVDARLGHDHRFASEEE